MHVHEHAFIHPPTWSDRRTCGKSALNISSVPYLRAANTSSVIFFRTDIDTSIERVIVGEIESKVFTPNRHSYTAPRWAIHRVIVYISAARNSMNLRCVEVKYVLGS